MRRMFGFLIGIFVGALVGSTVALLLAPESGEEIRAELRDARPPARRSGLDEGATRRPRHQGVGAIRFRFSRAVGQQLPRGGDHVLEELVGAEARQAQVEEGGRPGSCRRQGWDQRRPPRPAPVL